ncbi:MAG TPA: hypothetical protein P5056_01825 [Candidatus Paceibacterota bacterium]|nr:hypothetical protein [Candidatus Paceibacterota bacterium]
MIAMINCLTFALAVMVATIFVVGLVYIFARFFCWAKSERFWEDLF